MATGSTPETTQFSLPAGMPSGTYNLSVVANGIASSPLSSLSFSAVPTADLAVTDTGPASLTAGTNATYTITLTNNGPGAATAVLLSDLLPAESTLVSFSQTSGSDSFTISQPQTNVVAAAISSIPAGSSDTFTLMVSAPANLYNGDPFSNTATVSTNANDPNSSNNTATATDSIINANQTSAFVVANVGLSGTLTTIAGPTGTIAEAGQATYLFTVTNTGPIDSPPNTVLTDVLGSGMTAVSAVYGDGGVGINLSVPNEVLIDFGSIPAGQLVTAKVTVEYTGFGTLTNSASASQHLRSQHDHQHVGRQRDRARGLDRCLRSNRSERQEPEQHDSGDIYPCRWRGASQQFRRHDQLGRQLNFTGDHYAVGHNVHGEGFPHLRQEWLPYRHDDGRRSGRSRAKPDGDDLQRQRGNSRGLGLYAIQCGGHRRSNRFGERRRICLDKPSRGRRLNRRPRRTHGKRGGLERFDRALVEQGEPGRQQPITDTDVQDALFETLDESVSDSSLAGTRTGLWS